MPRAPLFFLAAAALLLVLAGPAAARERGDTRELARKAIAAIRAAGLDPAEEIETENTMRPDLSDAAEDAIEEAGLDRQDVREALRQHPELITAGGAPEPADRPDQPDYPPGPGTDEPPPPPPPDNPGPDPGRPRQGVADGFGQKARGASGPVRNVSGGAGQIASALRSGGNLRLAGGDVDAGFGQLEVKGNTTLDGNGTTIWLPGTNHNGKGLGILGQNIIVRNLRVRNSGDGVYFGSSSSRGVTADALVENVSVTGCGDDGFSVAYDCRNVTVRWCFMAGNARCVFMKYGGANLTMHHNILTHYWIRGPLVSGDEARIDFRNNLVQHWGGWGSRTESGARGDFVNNTWRFERWAGPKPDKAVYNSGGQLYAAGNEFVGCSPRREDFSRSSVIDAPPVPTDSAAEALRMVLDEQSGAGCMPRDQVDINYLNAREACPTGDPPHGLQVPGSRLD